MATLGPPPPEIAGKPKLRLFLVEDNEDTRLMLELLLRGYGFEVRAAGTMQAALAGFPLFASEVLLSDIGLPDGDGWELLGRLRQDGFSPYAVAMSGFGTVTDIAASQQAGFRHHLVKPIELDELERILAEARRELEAP